MSIDLFGAIGDPGSTLVDIQLALDVGERTVRINSGGGDAFVGQGVYSLLAAAEPPVTVEILGVAASAASVIAMAGRPIRMADNALLMVHPAQAHTGGTANDLRSTVQLLEGIDSAAVSLYAARANVSQDTARKWLDDSTWFTADQALAVGLVDEVFTPAERVRAEIPLHGVPYSATAVNTCEVPVMKVLLEKLGLPDTATEDEAVAALAGLLAAQSVTSEAIPDAVAQLHTATVLQAVTQAITDGKVMPSMRDQAIAACGTTPAQLNAAVSYWQKSPKLTAPTVVVGAPVESGRRTLTAAQKKMIEGSGLTAEQFLAQRYGESRVG